MAAKRYFDGQGNKTLYGMSKGEFGDIFREKINLISVVSMIFIAVIITWMISLFFDADTKIGPQVSLFIYALSVYAAFRAMSWMGSISQQQRSAGRIIGLLIIVFIGLLALLWNLPHIVPSLYSTVEISQGINQGLNSIFGLG